MSIPLRIRAATAASFRRNDDSSSPGTRAQKYLKDGLDILYGAESSPAKLRPNTANIEQAIVSFKKAIFLKPDTKELYYARADAALQLHDIRSAVSNLRFALKIDPGDFQTRRKLSKLTDVQGLSWLEVHSYEMALAYFDAALKLDPVVGIFHIHRAVALVHLKEYHQALKSVDDALSCMSPSADHFVLRGKIYWALRLSDLGNTEFRRAQEMDPNHPEVLAFHEEMVRQAEHLYSKAVDAMRRKKFSTAIDYLTQALGLSAEDLRLRLLRASAYRKEGAYEKALEDLDEAAFEYFASMKGQGESHPRTRAQRLKLLSVMRLGDDYKEPQQVSRERALVFNDIALELFTEKRYEQAITYLNRAIESEEKVMFCNNRSTNEVNFRFFLNRGDCYRSLGLLEQALSDFHRALEANPDDWQIKTRLSMIHYMYGNILFNKRQFLPAQMEFNRAINYNPKVSMYHMQRGKACFYQQNIEGAYENYKTALNLDPDNLEIKLLLQQFDPEVDLRANKSVHHQQQEGEDFQQHIPTAAEIKLQRTIQRENDLIEVNPHLATAIKTLHHTKLKREVVTKIYAKRPEMKRDMRLWSLTTQKKAEPSFYRKKNQSTLLSKSKNMSSMRTKT